MKKDKVNEALGLVADEHVAEAANYKKGLPFFSGRGAGDNAKLNGKVPRLWLPAIAVVLVLAILIIPLVRPAGGPPISTKPSATMATQGSGTVGHLENPFKTLSAVDYSRAKLPDYEDRQAAAMELRSFFEKTISQVLSGGDGGNKIYSPANLYMALCLAAELSDGNGQLMELLGAESLEALRSQANTVWNTLYTDEDSESRGVAKTLLANSLWLRSGMEYDQTVTDALAEHYFASSYWANLGTSEANGQIADWINENTDNLLQEATENIWLTPETVFAAASTVYYRAQWISGFYEDYNIQGIFHGTQDAECTFMRKLQWNDTYYRGENFGAVALDTNNGRMYVFLPDEGTSPEELLASGAYLDCIYPESGDRRVQAVSTRINLSLPKFDVQSQGSLVEDLQTLGVTDIFEISKTPFDKFLKGTPAAIDTVFQAARVAVDEDGITAASFVLLGGPGAAIPPADEVDFVVDRPFLFVVVSDSIPLFAGVVEDLS